MGPPPEVDCVVLLTGRSGPVLVDPARGNSGIIQQGHGVSAAIIHAEARWGSGGGEAKSRVQGSKYKFGRCRLWTRDFGPWTVSLAPRRKLGPSMTARILVSESSRAGRKVFFDFAT